MVCEETGSLFELVILCSAGHEAAIAMCVFHAKLKVETLVKLASPPLYTSTQSRQLKLHFQGFPPALLLFLLLIKPV